MRDYKTPIFQPQLKNTRRHVFRKLLLFAVIATLASLYFFHFEPTQPPKPQPQVAVSKLSLPDISETVPDEKLAPVQTGQPIEILTPIETTETASSQADDSAAATITEPELEPGPAKSSEESLAEQAILTDTAKTADSLPAMSATWENYVIKSGDSLANIFKEWDLSASTLHKIVNSSKKAAKLADIHPGETLKLLRDDDSNLLELVVVRSPTESLVISKTESGYEAETVTREVDVVHAYAGGTINSSLFVDGQQAGLTDAQIMEMAGIFGWDIDFALEIRKGDSFKLLFEEHFLDGEKLRNGPILVAEFHNNKKVYRAVRYTTPDGITSYYDPIDGRNKKRTFIRTPVKFARISSRFTNKRYHPKLKKWRAHRGVDYAAPTGTPVKAAGNGKVIFRGVKGGYGKVVIIQHGSKYTTLYAHLSKYSKASKKGRSVSQGQVIGYVGQTGLATGPHLHYEFRVNGVHRNPLTVKLPKADPINKKYRKDFDAASGELLAEFKLRASGDNQVAQTSENSKHDG